MIYSCFFLLLLLLLKKFFTKQTQLLNTVEQITLHYIVHNIKIVCL